MSEWIQPTMRERFMKFEMYRDEAGEWRWRLKAVNGLIIATSGEGYVNKEDCRAGCMLVKGCGNALIEDV